MHRRQAARGRRSAGNRAGPGPALPAWPRRRHPGRRGSPGMARATPCPPAASRAVSGRTPAGRPAPPKSVVAYPEGVSAARRRISRPAPEGGGQAGLRTALALSVRIGVSRPPSSSDASSTWTGTSSPTTRSGPRPAPTRWSTRNAGSKLASSSGARPGFGATSSIFSKRRRSSSRLASAELLPGSNCLSQTNRVTPGGGRPSPSDHAVAPAGGALLRRRAP